MALFGRKKPKVDRTGLEAVMVVTAFSIARLKALGIEADVTPGTSGHGTTLTDTVGRTYNLNTLFLRVGNEPQGEVMPIVTEYIDSLVDATEPTPTNELSAEELTTRIRVRLQPEGFASQPGYSYARPVAPGLVAVLCVDHPATVEYLTDEFFTTREVIPLFNAGFANVMAEPVEHVDDPVPGVRRVIGDLFTATKVLGMGQLTGSLIPAAPHGVLFIVPHRQTFYSHAVTGRETIDAVNHLGVFLKAQIEDAPGGVLSRHLYYWRDSVFDVAGTLDESRRLQVNGSGRFGEALGAAIG